MINAGSLWVARWECIRRSGLIVDLLPVSTSHLSDHATIVRPCKMLGRECDPHSVGLTKLVRWDSLTVNMGQGCYWHRYRWERPPVSVTVAVFMHILSTRVKPKSDHWLRLMKDPSYCLKFAKQKNDFQQHSEQVWLRLHSLTSEQLRGCLEVAITCKLSGCWEIDS